MPPKLELLSHSITNTLSLSLSLSLYIYIYISLTKLFTKFWFFSPVSLPLFWKFSSVCKKSPFFFPHGFPDYCEKFLNAETGIFFRPDKLIKERVLDSPNHFQSLNHYFPSNCNICNGHQLPIHRDVWFHIQSQLFLLICLKVCTNTSITLWKKLSLFVFNLLNFRRLLNPLLLFLSQILGWCWSSGLCLLCIVIDLCLPSVPLGVTPHQLFFPIFAWHGKQDLNDSKKKKKKKKKKYNL